MRWLFRHGICTGFGRRRGFTFVETILAVVVISAIAGVAAKVLITGLDVYALIVNRDDASQRARLAMERMEDEIVFIGTGDIFSAGNTKLRFRDSGGTSTYFSQKNESINGQVIPCLFRGSDILAENVVSLDFDYFRSNGNSTYWPWRVRFINVDMSVEASADAGSIHLRTNVFPRNFMYDNFE